MTFSLFFFLSFFFFAPPPPFASLETLFPPLSLEVLVFCCTEYIQRSETYKQNTHNHNDNKKNTDEKHKERLKEKNLVPL